jgi:D-alanyl-D-alanine carboxypeptidase (penicillin-binding protein 5/6)
VKYGLLFLAFCLGQILAASPAGATVRKHHPHAVQESGEEGAGTLSATSIDPNKPPAVRAQSVIVVDAETGEVLYEKNADAPRQIASTTKLMTAMLVAESGDLDKEVTVETEDTLCEPTKLNFKAGERYDRRSLLFALLVHSCNDVARCLARDNAGTIFEFAAKMDLRAHELGALNTEFVNPNGLPSPGEDQHSTARDLSRIARAAYANPLIRQIVATKTLVFQYADGRTREFTNTNKVLGRYPLCNGMKTGYTDAAGHCLVSSAVSGNRTVIAVCLGDNQSIWNDSQRLLMWGMASRADRNGTPVQVTKSNPAPAG